MKLLRALNDYVRNLGHQVNADGTAVAILQKLVAHRCRNIPQHHAAIALLHFIKKRFRSFFQPHTLYNGILVLPAGEFMQDIVDGTIPVNQEELSGRKNPAVHLIREENPDGGPDQLHSKYLNKRGRRNQISMDQSQLKIGDHVHAQQRKQLGHENLHRLHETDSQPSVQIGKQQENHRINAKNQYMTPAVQLNILPTQEKRMIKIKPYPGIQPDDDRNSK